MRRAWEQAAACVIAPSGRLSAGSGEVLAERLGVTLIFVDEDPLIVAVRVASAASRPDAARTQLVARCATRLAEAGASARRVLGVLNAELPGTSVAFLDRYGRHLAGRHRAIPTVEIVGADHASEGSGAVGHPAGPAGPAGAVGGFRGGGAGERFAAAGPGGGASSPVPGVRVAGARWSAEVEVPDEEGSVLGMLVAGGSSRSLEWPSVVRTVLGLAVAPLTAWAARERLRASRGFALQAALAERLLTEARATAPAPREPKHGEPHADPAGTHGPGRSAAGAARAGTDAGDPRAEASHVSGPGEGRAEVGWPVADASGPAAEAGAKEEPEAEA
ncbi:hypothetical protein EJK15_69565, partial [Nonomuraea basaltis]